jgi:hypothetical protein
MCWNEKISWTTFIIGTILNLLFAFIKKERNYTLLAIIFQLVITVQLGEALIWREPNCKDIGKIGSNIAFYSVFLQPFAALLYIYIVYGINDKITKISILLTIIYIIFSIYYIPKLDICAKPESCCSDNRKHINEGGWKNSGYMGIFYGICVIYFTIILSIKNSKFTLLSFYIILSMIFSFLFYKKSFASMWCWFSAFSPIILFLVY